MRMACLRRPTTIDNFSFENQSACVDENWRRDVVASVPWFFWPQPPDFRAPIRQISWSGVR